MRHGLSDLRRGVWPRLMGGVVVLSLLWALTACVGSPEAGSVPTPTSAPLRPTQTIRLVWVSSYHNRDPWTLQIQTGILETLARNGYSLAEGTLEWKPIYMDVTQSPLASDMTPVADLVIARVQAFNPTVVIVSDDEAIRTVIPRYPDARLPFVYCGLNSDPQEYDLVRPNVTGVLEVVRPEQNLEIARAFVGGSGRYLILSDASVSGKIMARNIYQTLKAYRPESPPAFRVTSEWEVWQNVVLQAGNYDFILLTSVSYAQDSEGNDMDQATLLAWMLENSPVPFFAVSSEAIRHGAVAGLTPSGYAQGARAAELTLRIVQGTSPAAIPVDASGRSALLMNLAAARKWELPIPVTFPLVAEVYRVLPSSTLPAAVNAPPQGGVND